MSRTVTAFYDTRAEAEAARERLSSQFDVDGRAKIIDKGSSDFQSVPLSNEDRNAYNEGLNRGGFMLCAEVDGDEDADRIVSVLEQTSSVDLDERQNSWRNEGWSGGSNGGESSFGQSNFGQNSTGERGNVVEEEHIPVVEEQFRVGKREVERGGARVRSYVEERPVNEQVNLREEHVTVERRPVGESLSSGDLNNNEDLLRERSVEMRETSEEPVIGKEARVNEEVVLKKTAEERTENVQDSVRQTKVDVDGNDTFTNR